MTKKSGPATGKSLTGNGPSVRPAGKGLSKKSLPKSNRDSGVYTPVSKIHRQYKGRLIGVNRPSRYGSLYTAGVLDHVTTEILVAAIKQAQSESKAKITPHILTKVFSSDPDLASFLSSSIIHSGGHASRDFSFA